jgi:hypothetical protein
VIYSSNGWYIADIIILIVPVVPDPGLPFSVACRGQLIDMPSPNTRLSVPYYPE